MKTNHLHLRVKATAYATLASVLTLTACSSGNPSNEHESSTDEALVRAAPASGVDVFNGVFFGTGPVGGKLSTWTPEARAQASAKPPAAQIPKLESAIAQMKAANWSPDAIATAEEALATLRKSGGLPQGDAKVRALQQDFILKQIVARDPKFLDRFGTEMQSGDPVRVDAAFKEGITLLRSVVSAPAAGLNVNVVPPNYWHPQHEGTSSDGSLAVAVAVAVAIAWVIVVFWFIGVQAESTTRLGHDQLIVKLTDELHSG